MAMQPPTQAAPSYTHLIYSLETRLLIIAKFIV